MGIRRGCPVLRAVFCSLSPVATRRAPLASPARLSSSQACEGGENGVGQSCRCPWFCFFRSRQPFLSADARLFEDAEHLLVEQFVLKSVAERLHATRKCASKYL